MSARFIWLHTTILYSTALYYIVLFSTIHYCIVLYCTILYSTVMYCTLSYCFELYYCFDQRWIKRKWTSAWDTWWTYALGIQNQSELCASLPKEEPQGSKVSTFIRQFCQFQKPTTRQNQCIYEDGQTYKLALSIQTATNPSSRYKKIRPYNDLLSNTHIFREQFYPWSPTVH